MKILLFCIAFLCLGVMAFGKPVSEAAAYATGLNFLLKNAKNAFLTSHSLRLTYKSGSNTNGADTIYYYVFNAEHGFVIIAGDDQANPILGYSDEGSFNPDNIPVHVAEWLNRYSDQMKNIVENNIATSPEITSKWTELISNAPYAIEAAPGASQQTATSIAPLLQAKWDQYPYYNALCPNEYVAGCVAIAMAQVMKFWDYPTIGIGSHTYNDPGSKMTLSANFGTTTYPWDSMPNSISESNMPIATLIYQCGVSVNMNYGASSAAYVLSQGSPVQNCAQYALKTYFGYDNSLSGIFRKNYKTEQDWVDVIKNEIDSGRPVIYSGGDHCFVCDGYNNSNNYFHFNWGWGGMYDGYFTVDLLNPGGTYFFNDHQIALIGIKPNPLLNYKLALDRNLKLSRDSFSYNDSFKITAVVSNVNNLSTAFYGDFCAEIFDNSNNLLDSFGTNKGLIIGLGKNSGIITFTCSGEANVLPGTYFVKILYRRSGGNGWTILGDNLPYINGAQIKTYSANSMELSSPIISFPYTLLHGNSISTIFNLINHGPSTFTGSIYAYLYNLNGTKNFLIGQKKTSLASNDTFADGLGFTNNYDSVSPGNYLLAILFSPDNGIPFQLAGSLHHPNPILVTVSAPDVLSPDKYEPNNTSGSAYKFTPIYVADSSEITTVGSNINTGSDVDFYRIDLPAGYAYSVNAHLNTSGYSTDSLTYTLNGSFSFTTDLGSNWSDIYDEMPDSTLKGKNSVIFNVTSNIPGETGTYLLDIKLKRTPVSGIETASINPDLLKVYPNPATDVLNLDYFNIHQPIKQLVIIDMTGKPVFAANVPEGKVVSQISVGNLPTGLYIVQLETANSLINKQVSIVR